MGMLDALGKSLGVPLYDLLGGKHTERVPFAYCVGILGPEDSRTHAKRALDMGFEVLKMKAGNDWKEKLKRIQAMHDEAGGQLEFRVDPNQALSPEDAVKFAAELENDGIYLPYLEQPIQTERFGTIKCLRIPIAANEDAYFDGNLYHLLKQDAIDVAVVDMIPSGGIHAVREAASMCAQAGMSVAHNSSFDLGVKTAAVLHTFASTPEMNLAPDTIYYSWEDNVISTKFEIVDGSIAVPDGDGLGIGVDQRKLEQYRL